MEDVKLLIMNCEGHYREREKMLNAVMATYNGSCLKQAEEGRPRPTGLPVANSCTPQSEAALCSIYEKASKSVSRKTPGGSSKAASAASSPLLEGQEARVAGSAKRGWSTAQSLSKRSRSPTVMSVLRAAWMP